MEEKYFVIEVEEMAVIRVEEFDELDPAVDCYKKLVDNADVSDGGFEDDLEAFIKGLDNSCTFLYTNNYGTEYSITIFAKRTD